MRAYEENPPRVWTYNVDSGLYTTAENLGTSVATVVVENVNLYNYKDLEGITREELFTWILVDKILEQFTGVDIAAAAAIVAGGNYIPTRAKFSGATKGTSPASLVSRKLLNKQMPFRAPTITGTSLRTLRIRYTQHLGAWVGRAVPVVGWVVMAYDVGEILRKTLVTYNSMAHKGDRLW